ncbi:MAG: 3-phosphoshikimate 1-carboxyvinyltransferase [Nitriliruptoraceae bacterium]
MSPTARVLLDAVPAPVAGAVVVPGSKSVTNRVVLAAGLADGTSTLHGPLDADDTVHMRALATGLGAGIEVAGDRWNVHGTGGRVLPQADELFVGQSGTTMRFGAAVATRAERGVRLTGTDDLHARPIGPLTAALRSLGARIDDVDGFPPVSIAPAAMHGGRVEVAGSSQFLSALLLLGPLLDDELTVLGAGGGAYGYVGLTVDVLRAFGASVDVDGARWQIAGGTGYRATEYTIAPDISGACHVWALAMATGGAVTVRRAALGADQPDAATLDVFAAMGGHVVADGQDITVRGPEQLDAVNIDLTAMPDQLPTLAVLAAIADGTSRFAGAQVTRGHETDRIRAMANELTRCGVSVTELPDGLEVTGGGGPPSPVTVDAHRDHRIAMAFAAFGARFGGVTIADADCVGKTFPTFWDVSRTLGVPVARTSAS